MALFQSFQAAIDFSCLGSYVLAIQCNLFFPALIVFKFCTIGITSFIAWTVLLLYVTLGVMPLTWWQPSWAQNFIQYTCNSAARYFPIHVVVADEESFKPGTPYMVGFEPHSALPTAMTALFARSSTLLPKGLRGSCYCLSSSICFKIPIVRQLWWWVGVRPATREAIHGILANRESVVVIPGGVQECLYMEHESEVVFLRSRTGFVRLALQHGAPLVPVYAFGQTATYGWYRPGPPWIPASVVQLISRGIGFAPLILWGAYGTAVPKHAPITVVIGKPIPVPKVESPSPELVREYLDKFITELYELFEAHKAAAGLAGRQMKII